MKVKAIRSFNSIVGHVQFGQVFDLPDEFFNDYSIAGLVVKHSGEAEKRETKPEPTAKNRKTK